MKRHPRNWVPVAALFAFACIGGRAEAHRDDYLQIVQFVADQETHGGDSYYLDKPYIWVSSSDGKTYDGLNPGQLAFLINPDYIYTQPALGFVQPPTQSIRFRGSGSSQRSFSMSGGQKLYITEYLPPDTQHTPIELCNMHKASRGPNAMKDGFVVIQPNAYEIHGRMDYTNEWSQQQTLTDTIQSDVQILCAGGGKPAPPTRNPATPSPTTPTAADDISPGFLITSANVSISPAYNPLNTPNCPVTVPIVLLFQGTQPQTFQYRVVSAEGGVSKTYSGKLAAAGGGQFKATREIQIQVPEAAPEPVSPQAGGGFVPGTGGPPTPQGPTTLQSVGGGGTPPTLGPAAIVQETQPGVHADSFRIEVKNPNNLVSEFAGYRVICKQEPPIGSTSIAMVPNPQTPPPGERLAAEQPTSPPPVTAGSQLAVQPSVPQPADRPMEEIGLTSRQRVLQTPAAVPAGARSNGFLDLGNGRTEIVGIAWGGNASPASMGLAAGTPPPGARSVTIRKQLDKSSPLIAKALHGRTRFPDATLTIPASGAAQKYMEFRLVDAMISSYQATASHETFTVNFAAMQQGAAKTPVAPAVSASAVAPQSVPTARAVPSRTLAAVQSTVPQLVLGADRRKAGDRLVISSAQAKPGSAPGQCRVSGLQVEWPGSAAPANAAARSAGMPSIRLGSQAIRPARVVPGTVTVLVLPDLDLAPGSKPLEVGDATTAAKWSLDVQATCGARAAMPMSTPTPVQRAPTQTEPLGRPPGRTP
jgi:hypothetical protein